MNKKNMDIILIGIILIITLGILFLVATRKGDSSSSQMSSSAFEMVVIANSSKQTFKIYGSNQIGITKVIQSLKSNRWNIPNTVRLSKT